MSKRYDLLDPSENQLGTSSGIIPIRVTPEQALALAHAAQPGVQVAMSLGRVDETLAESLNPTDRALVIEAYLDEDGQHALLVNYAWNIEGAGAWLEADGGWHYGPDESGFYPWRESR